MNWDTIQNLFSNIVFLILLIAMICYWINLLSSNKLEILSKFGQLTIVFAISFLILILSSRWIVAGYFPLSNLYESLLFLTCLLLIFYLYIEIQTKSKLIGSILLPTSLLINGFANLTLSPDMQKSSPLVPSLQSNWLMMHVSMMLLSYAILIIGSMLCLLFIVLSKFQEINLQTTDNLSLYKILNYHYKTNTLIRNDKLFKFGKLKLLQNIDIWSYRIIGFGFPFLTLGIISGGVWANEAWGSYWSWDPKETWALITWLVFAIYLHARITKGWVGKKTAILGSLGFFVIWICYLGVNFLGKGLHSYGWII